MVFDMQKLEQTDVLVAGAGPVGLLSALLLAEAGVDVVIIDHEWRRASRSYACGLHGRSLELLDKLGLASPLLKLGRRIEKLAFYERAQRVAEVNLSALGGKYPFLLLVPQSELESLLEAQLRCQDKVKVLWNHRLVSLMPDEARVMATIDRLAETATGYIVPNWDWVVTKTLHTRAYYVVGADGHNSYVRRALGIEFAPGAAPEWYDVFEFDCDQDPGPEGVVVFDGDLVNVLWPLGERRCRWSFQQPLAGAAEEFPPKTRTLTEIVHQGRSDELVRELETLLDRRAPFFEAGVREVVWSGRVRFAPRVARQFGQGRCWLAGDAAHQTGPVGMQSLNVGLLEARDLADRLRRLMFNEAAPETLADYQAGRQAEWRGLLGLAGGLKPGPSAASWARQRAGRLLSMLPATGEDLRRLAGQLGLGLG